MRKIIACLALLFILAACGQKAEAIPTPATAVPYQTMTFTQAISLTPVLTGILTATPTVINYTVVQGDTLSSIAQHSGVSLEALVAANPGISATTLSVGTKLIIPAGDQAPIEVTPTSVPLPLQQAHCWPETTGGLWCFVLVQNTYPETLENLSAQFALLDASGKELASQIAYGLLDILPPGMSMPLAAHFASPVQLDANLRVQVLTAMRLSPGDPRYLPVRVENMLVSVDASGRTARTSGRVLLTGTGTTNTVWVLATAYDGAGNVVGVRRWESDTPLTEVTPISFDFLISSVGPEIARVEFLVEARS